MTIILIISTSSGRDRAGSPRSPGGGNEDLVLANLRPGSTFGEDALISESARSATVTATSDGMLMRLSRKDFDMMLVGQRVQWVDFGEVKQ